MRIVQDFDQAVLQLEALVQHGTQLLQLLLQLLLVSRIGDMAVAIVETKRFLGGDLDARVELVDQLKSAIVLEVFSFTNQLAVYFKMTGRQLIDQHIAELAAWPVRLIAWLGAFTQGTVMLDQLLAFGQPAINQLMHTAPTFLGCLATFQHLGPRLSDSRAWYPGLGVFACITRSGATQRG